MPRARNRAPAIWGKGECYALSFSLLLVMSVEILHSVGSSGGSSKADATIVIFTNSGERGYDRLWKDRSHTKHWPTSWLLADLYV